MTETSTKLPVHAEEKTAGKHAWRPVENLRREVDRLFEDFDRDFWRAPFRRSFHDIEPLLRRGLSWGATPAVDIVDKNDAYQVIAELPGMDEKNIEVKLVNGSLIIKGEKRDEKEEKKKDYYLHERSFGAFERSFALPDEVNVDKIDASFNKGVLTVTLPKKPEAVKPEKKIEIKAG
ncbi:MAG: HSP20 family protein [Alphaproteobacteria bacterium]|nr:HSP20 family protein [Alphaproteobacteria bacterium]